MTLDTPLTLAALAIATEAHAADTRRDGSPYIGHPKQVRDIATRLYLDSEMHIESIRARSVELVRAVSVLHDVPEDHPEAYTEIGLAMTLADQGLLDAAETETVGVALHRLNKRNYASYLDLILAAKGHWLSRLVKRADLLHNLSDSPSKATREKYLLALHILKS